MLFHSKKYKKDKKLRGREMCTSLLHKGLDKNHQTDYSLRCIYIRMYAMTSIQ